ncbi:MAG: aspartate carbamoyltransferase catalytic subunit, partial [Gammaproteobacteria bacterium]
RSDITTMANDTAMNTMQHFLQIEDFSRDTLLQLIDKANTIIHTDQKQQQQRGILAGKTLVNLFLEPSTRTRVSFELAARRLGGEVINLDNQQSSMRKNEDLLDTILSLQAMDCQLFALRHPKNSTVTTVSKQVPKGIAIINAGDGTRAHPSQALLDMLTIQQHKQDFSNLTVAIIGDIKHSRVANSQITALRRLGVKEIRLIGPETLLLTDLNDPLITTETSLVQGLQDADVVIVLRIQQERFQTEALPDLKEYYQHYGLTQSKLAHAKPDAIVMHPGPVNRGIEIDTEICDGPQSVIRQQISNGVAMRMAILSTLVKNLLQ